MAAALRAARLCWAALEGFVRALYPDCAQPVAAIERAERQLSHRTYAWPVHSRAVAEHLRGHVRNQPSDTAASVASGVAAEMALHRQAVHGIAAVPAPIDDVDAKIHATGHEEICAAREATTAVMLGIQVLLAAALDEGMLCFSKRTSTSSTAG